jgi:hypothetical protein
MDVVCSSSKERTSRRTVLVTPVKPVTVSAVTAGVPTTLLMLAAVVDG